MSYELPQAVCVHCGTPTVYSHPHETCCTQCGKYVAGELHITAEGVAVVESGLTLRQAHELKTGCQPDALCDECRDYIGEA